MTGSISRSSRPRVTVVSVQGRSGLPADEAARLEAVADVTFLRRSAPMGHADAVAALAGAEIAGLTPKIAPRLDAQLLAALPSLHTVALHATGYDLFDLTALESHGVQLVTLPDYSTTSVAEHAMGLILSLSRRIHLAHDRSRGLAAPGTSLRGFELEGRQLGIVGVGRIGSRVARLAAAFGMQVVGSELHAPAPTSLPLLGLRRLLGSSDVVLLACSREHGAPPLIGAAELATMREGSVLVNVSRAELVDSDAAVAAVRARRLRGYAVDDAVVDPGRDGDLLAEGRILQTGHSAWWSDEVLARGAAMWAQTLHRLAVGEPVRAVTRAGAGDPLRGVGAVEEPGDPLPVSR